jgi:SHAQKYF class myb-like DNA-binding protein
MANILNRSHPVAAPPSQQAPPPSLPKFSLPSLHSFGKPLITKQEPSMNRVRSILNDPPSVSGSVSDGNITSTSESSPLTTAQTPADVNDTPRKMAPSRRIAPAPTDDDEGGDEENGSDSIRGGRWSSEEHDRFLAGFRIHGHKWKRVQQVVRTRSVTQVRTHAQKYLLKLAKLKGEKKPAGGDATNINSPSDTESAHNQAHDEVDERSPRKKMRRYDPTTESVDEEYITAAASTLCFLMRQKIDSLFDNRMDEEKDLEPYDCYSSEPSPDSREDHSIENSRKRPYMHFITESTVSLCRKEPH